MGYLAHQLCFGPGYQGRDPVDVEQDLLVAGMGDCCLFELAQVEDRVIELLVDLLVDKIANKLIELVLEEDQVEQPPGYLSEGKLRFVLALLLEFERLGQSLVLECQNGLTLVVGVEAVVEEGHVLLYLPFEGTV